jgi:hypothetical protein
MSNQLRTYLRNCGPVGKNDGTNYSIRSLCSEWYADPEIAVNPQRFATAFGSPG